MKVKLQLLLAEWLGNREEGQDTAITRCSHAREAFRAACLLPARTKGPQQSVLWMQLAFCPSAGAGGPHAVSLKGRCKDCQCPWGSLRKSVPSPAPSRPALRSNYSYKHLSPVVLPALLHVVQTHSGVITPDSSLSYLHLGHPSICSIA